jgi:hypothetical protein
MDQQETYREGGETLGLLKEKEIMAATDRRP